MLDFEYAKALVGKYTFIEDISANAKGYDRLFQIM